MHDAQIRAWQWFAQHRPKGEYINDDIYEGFARNLYLSVGEFKLQWHVRPLRLNLLRRIKLAFSVMFHGTLTLNAKPIIFEMASANDPEAVLVNVTINRYKDGTVKASYTPVDRLTENLLNNANPGK